MFDWSSDTCDWWCWRSWASAANVSTNVVSGSNMSIMIYGNVGKVNCGLLFVLFTEKICSMFSVNWRFVDNKISPQIVYWKKIDKKGYFCLNNYTYLIGDIVSHFKSSFSNRTHMYVFYVYSLLNPNVIHVLLCMVCVCAQFYTLLFKENLTWHCSKIALIFLKTFNLSTTPLPPQFTCIMNFYRILNAVCVLSGSCAWRSLW